MTRMAKKARTNNLLPLQKKILKGLTAEHSVQLFKTEMQIENLAVRTIDFHLENLHVFYKFLKDQGIEVTLNTITKQLIKENFILYMLQQKYKANTINGRIKTLRKYLSFLFSEGYITRNIAPELKRVKGSKVKIDAFTKEQIVALLDQPDQESFTGFRDYTMMLLLLDCGLRLSELCKLQLYHLNLKEGIISLDEAAAAKYGIGDVPISKKCSKILGIYLEYREARNPECNNIFITVDGKALNRSTIQDKLREYGRKADLRNVRVSPHTFRHSFAKYYILAGGDAFSLQKILRHQNIETVKIYVNLWGTEVKKQHDKFSPLNDF